MTMQTRAAFALAASPDLAEQGVAVAAHARDGAAPTGDPTAAFAVAAVAMMAALVLAHHITRGR